jgi:flagellar biosynthesis regulator FlbT
MKRQGKPITRKELEEMTKQQKKDEIKRSLKRMGNVILEIAIKNDFKDIFGITLTRNYMEGVKTRIITKKETYIDKILIAETTYKTPEKARELIEYEMKH